MSEELDPADGSNYTGLSAASHGAVARAKMGYFEPHGKLGDLLRPAMGEEDVGVLQVHRY